MGQPVSRLRDKFYRRLILEYRKDGVDSFLYRYFWTESVTELLQKYLPIYSGPVQPEDEDRIREALRKCPDLEPKKPDFWEGLWLRDARVRAGLISKADYCLWLAEYLAAHDIYYKDTSMWDGRLWLDTLLKKGLDWREGMREPGRREQKGDGPKDAGEAGSQTPACSDRVYTTQLKKDLRQLAEEIGRDRAKIAGRLEGLGEGDRSVLTARLKQMALHVKIKNWLQNSGYYLPTIKEKDMGKELFQRESRERQDFTLRMFEAYCAGPGGSLFFNAASDGGTDSGDWRLDGQGFCLLETDRLEALQKALEGEEARLYLPLGVDPRSGCVFFLAGKELYRELYEAEETKAEEAFEQAQRALELKKEQYERVKRGQNDIWIKKAKGLYEAAQEVCDEKEAACQRARRAREDYEASPARFCFDFLRLDGGRFPRDVGGAFRLRPKFHENVKKSYQDILEDFEWYCVDGDEREPGAGSPREAVRELNQEGPTRIPEELRWAFDVPDSQEEASPAAAKAFEKSRNRSDRTAAPGRKRELAKTSNVF